MTNSTELQASEVAQGTLTSTKLPIKVFNEPAPTKGDVDRRSFLLVEKTTPAELYGIPIYVVRQMDFQSVDHQGVPNFAACRTKEYIHRAHALVDLRGRADKMGELFHEGQYVNGQGLPELVLESLGRVLDPQLSMDSNERSHQLEAAFIGTESEFYDSTAVLAALDKNAGKISLPAWKWLEIKIAHAALTFLEITLNGLSHTWEEIWGNTGAPSDSVQVAIASLPINSDKEKELVATAFATAVNTHFYSIAEMSIRVQNLIAAQKAT